MLHRLIDRTPQRVQRDTLELELDDGRRVEVQRVRDPRARRLKLSVDERGARLTLPPLASLVSGDRFLHEHRSWLDAQLQRHLCADGQTPALEPGNTAHLPLRGDVVSLHWREGRCLRIVRDDSGFTIEQAVNAMVTGSFPFIGLSQEILTAPPAGSTFTVNFDAQPFASVDELPARMQNHPER